jgi:uncharacterized membrane protein YedE/YeeE
MKTRIIILFGIGITLAGTCSAQGFADAVSSGGPEVSVGMSIALGSLYLAFGPFKRKSNKHLSQRKY